MDLEVIHSGEVQKAFVVFAKGYLPSEEHKATLRQENRDRLTDYESPYIEFLDELPKTTS